VKDGREMRVIARELTGRAELESPRFSSCLADRQAAGGRDGGAASRHRRAEKFRLDAASC
jgi:hypothetical protein